MIYILSHRDFDGYTAAEILYRYYSTKDVKIYYSSLKSAKENLLKILDECTSKDIIYITDLSFSLNSELKNKILEKNVKIIWIDHHKTTKNYLEDFKKLKITLVFSDKYSAAGVVYRYLKLKNKRYRDPVSALLAYYADSIDLFKFKAKYSEKLAIISCIHDISEWWEDISKGLFWTKKLKELYTDALNVLKKEKERLTKSSEIIEINGKKIGLFITKYPYAVSYLSKMLEDYVDYMVFISDRISFRKKSTEDVDLSKIASKFGGGGHPFAAGAPLELSITEKLEIKLLKKVPKRIKEKILEAFKEYLDKKNI